MLRSIILLLVAQLSLLAGVNSAQIPNIAANAIEWSVSKASHIGDKGSDGIHTSTVWTFNDCGSPTDAVQIKSLRVDPDPPKPGEKLTIYATGTVKETIDEGAYADVVVKLGLIKLLTRRFDVCEELSKANATLQCPIKPGDYDIVQSVDLPREIPKAKFIVQARAFTQPPESSMACADIAIDFLRPNPH